MRAMDSDKNTNKTFTGREITNVKVVNDLQVEMSGIFIVSV